MRHSLFAFVLMGSCLATPVLAGVTVLGSGVGRDCYEETLVAPTPMRNLEALAVCDRAVADYTEGFHNRAASYVNRADILLRMRRFQEAVADSQKAIAINPQIGVAYLNRGAGLIGLERYDEALASLNQAIEMRVGELQVAYFDRAMARENLGDIKGAYRDYRMANRLDPGFQLAAEQLARFTVTTR